MSIYRNVAIGNTTYRKGEKSFTDDSFYDLAYKCLGVSQAFAMFLGYGEDFAAHVIEKGFSTKGFSGVSPAYFTDFPVDFDASESLPRALKNTQDFIKNELIDKGIDTRYFVIYLSGGKGFHVHISSSVLNVEQPLPNAGYRLKALVKLWKEKYSTIDTSIYNSIALFRLPGSKHKSGLHKTEIAYEDLNLEHLATKEIWAKNPPTYIRIPELGEPPVKLDLPAAHVAAALPAYTAEIDFDPDALITPNCPWLQKVLADPTSNGNDGAGREKRRDAVGILLTAHDISEANAELKWYVEELEKHPYMTSTRMEDVYKWIREYDQDGEIKCKKTCFSVGCSAPQRKVCGTKSPLDWKLKQRKLELVDVSDARDKNLETVREILSQPGNGIFVLPWPVGIGKTYTFMKEISGQGLTAFYTSQTHALALQTHLNFIDAGLNSRHVASRNYLAENEDFQCMAPEGVNLALTHGYGAYTVCGKCPRMPKKVKGKKEWTGQEEGFSPCEYYMQFEGLNKVDAVVGVHNHLYEFMYEKADVINRSVSVIDESPFEALGREFSKIEPKRLASIREGLAKIVAHLEGVKAETPKKSNRLFGAAAALIEAQINSVGEAEAKRRLRFVRAAQGAYAGEGFDAAYVRGLDALALRALWYELASEVAQLQGLSEAMAEGYDYLAVPHILPVALAYADADKIYTPEEDAWLPVELPPNKVLILDATALNDVYGPVLEKLIAKGESRNYTFIPHALVKQPYSYVTQITSSSYGVSRFDDEGTISFVQQMVIWLTQKHPGKSLIVCHKKHVASWRGAFRNSPEIEVAHYGALKGLNRWSDCVAQYIVGTPFVPDEGIHLLATRLGDDTPLHKLQTETHLRRVMLLAKDGSTCVVNRRVYTGARFHTALAQMKSQLEVTQAVRLRLYDQAIEATQQLYIFSNVELKGMYADTYKTINELAFELQLEQNQAAAEKGLEITGVAYDRLTAWFKELPKGAAFKSTAIPGDIAGLRYIRYWITAAVTASWLGKNGNVYTKLV